MKFYLLSLFLLLALCSSRSSRRMKSSPTELLVDKVYFNGRELHCDNIKLFYPTSEDSTGFKMQIKNPKRQIQDIFKTLIGYQNEEERSKSIITIPYGYIRTMIDNKMKTADVKENQYQFSMLIGKTMLGEWQALTFVYTVDTKNNINVGIRNYLDDLRKKYNSCHDRAKTLYEKMYEDMRLLILSTKTKVFQDFLGTNVEKLRKSIISKVKGYKGCIPNLHINHYIDTINNGNYEEINTARIELSDL